MNQERKPSNSSVAWYKLSILVSRGEREKALNVYRLLSHSFDDKAYALQLEGDILWSLDDQQASEKYKQAVFLYKKEKRWIDAIAVCKHLLTMDPHSPELLSSLLNLYVLINWHDKFTQTSNTIFDMVQQGVLNDSQLFAVIKNVIEFTREEQLGIGLQWLTQSIKNHEKDLSSLLKLQIDEMLG